MVQICDQPNPLSVVGDILFSAAKRWSGQKDMGAILPGHGGVLDRWDGMLFIIPFFPIVENIANI